MLNLTYTFLNSNFVQVPRTSALPHRLRQQPRIRRAKGSLGPRIRLQYKKQVMARKDILLQKCSQKMIIMANLLFEESERTKNCIEIKVKLKYRFYEDLFIVNLWVHSFS